jgi:hypothetical protein
MSITATSTAGTVGSTEYSLLAADAFSAASLRSADGYLDATIDLSALAAGDRFQVAAYEKVGAGLLRAVFSRVFEGPVLEGLVVRDMFVGEAYDLTAMKLAGTDRTIRATSYLFAPASPALAPGSATVGSSRISLITGTTTLAPQATRRRLQVWLDPSAMAAGDEYLLIVWAPAGGGAALPIYRSRLRGARATLFWTPTLTVGEAWDVTLEKVTGTDRAIRWSLRTDDGETTSVSTLPSFPALNTATTAESIRDRAIAVIEELVPRALADDRFRRYRNEGGADFQRWADKNPAGAWRRFQVRDDGTDQPPSVSNTEIEERRVHLVITLAYPHVHRAGPDNALDRDDAMSLDQHQIEHAIGMCGRANFSAPHPDACWLAEGSSTDREIGDACDFLVIRQTMTFRRTMT